MRAYVLSIGSELILGHLTDTNATFLAQELSSLGIELLHVVQVGDERPRITRTIAQAAADADLVICTGGVGPTEDDLTREAIADVVNETPVVDPELLSTVEAIFSGRGVTMPERNKKQAWLIPSAEPLPNPVGTAPGWYVQYGPAVIISMPGVPREMTRMWREQAVPRLSDRQPNRVVRSVTIKTVGIGESSAEEALDDLVRRTNPVVATYAKDDGVHIRVTGVGSDEAEAAGLRDAAAAEVRRRLDTFIYGADDDTLGSSLVDLIGRHTSALSIIDEGGGGRFAALLASAPRSSTLLKHALLRPRGVTDAVDLARLNSSEADLGLAITVTTEPAVDSFVSATVEIAVAGPVAAAQTFPLRGTHQEVHRRTALLAADVLRRALLGPFAST